MARPFYILDKKMGVNQALRIESDVVAENPVEIPFEFKKGTYPEDKDPGDRIVIKPITVRTVFRIKPYLAMIDKADLDIITAKKGVAFDSKINEIMTKYEEIIFEIVCLGLYNKKGKMPDWFRLGCNSFMNTITITMSVVSPLSGAEIIALQKNSESWSKRK